MLLPLAGIHSQTCSSSNGDVSHVGVPCVVIAIVGFEAAVDFLTL